MSKKLKAASKPKQSENFFIHQAENEFQLVREDDMQGVFINEHALIIFELCDGDRSVSDIKKMLKAAYPESAADMSDDIDQSLQTLLTHGAIKV